MLINATQSEEVRVALVKDNHLYDLDIECPSEAKKKGNIYKATVTRREPSLDAVFVEYGAKRQAFLSVKEIAPEYFCRRLEEFGDEKPPITALIREGQEILIQVDKEERGTKGAAVTTYITLAGCYLVLMPNSPRSGGISRRIEGDDRDELKETLNALELSEDMGIIIRTAGVGKSQEELQADLNMLCNQWAAIKQAYSTQASPCLIHQEGDVIIRSIRDNLRKSIDEIIIDDHVSYVKAKQYIEQVKPDFLPHLKLYNNNIPLFNYHQIESQIETAFQREVLLPSGGALVIDRTEALVSIDINSAKATSGPDIESTAFNTNLEAADEIARQLRLRDLGGLVVIDFIDMSSTKNQRDVENRLKEALKTDRARIQIGRISRFGLLEMSRQRLRLSLGETAQEVCPRCEGRGAVRNIQSHSLSIIRLIEEEALKDKTAQVQVQLPVEMATFLMNEKREFIHQIEKRHQVEVLVIANPYIHSPHYQITRIKDEQLGKHKKPSYSLIQQPDVEIARADSPNKIDEPAVTGYATAQSSLKKPATGFIKRVLGHLFGSDTTQASTASGQSANPIKTETRHTASETNQNRQEKRPQSANSSHNNRRRRPSGNTTQRHQNAAGTTTTGAAHPQNPQRNKRPNPNQQHHQQTGVKPAGTRQEQPKKKAPTTTHREPTDHQH